MFGGKTLDRADPAGRPEPVSDPEPDTGGVNLCQEVGKGGRIVKTTHTYRSWRRWE